MKRILSLILTLLVFCSLFAACKKPNEDVNTDSNAESSQVVSDPLTFDELREQAEKPVLTAEEAKEEALDRAAVTADSAENLLCNLEFNTAYLRWTYVVEFAQGGYEYTVDVDAVNGDLLNFFSKLQ